VLIDDDILHPAPFVENAAQSVLLILGMDAPVVGIGQELVWRNFSYAHDAVTPGGRNRGRRRRGGLGRFAGWHQ
jgi:hypothetical protein